jgi:hypothetical protein
MNTKKAILWVLGLSILALSGCIVSGTFTFTDVFKLTIANGYSHWYVDVTEDGDWEDAQENLDKIESIGFEMFITNPNATDAVLDVYVSNPPESEILGNISAVLADGTLALKGFTVPAGVSKFKMTYSQSFQLLENVDTLKKLAVGGKFHVYGIPGIPASPTSFSVDSAIVIITLNASST